MKQVKGNAQQALWPSRSGCELGAGAALMLHEQIPMIKGQKQHASHKLMTKISEVHLC